VTVDVGDLVETVGQPPFTSDRIYHTTPVGVVMGLAWTAMGGNALYVEAAAIKSIKSEGKGALQTTGGCPSVRPSVCLCVCLPVRLPVCDLKAWSDCYCGEPFSTFGRLSVCSSRAARRRDEGERHHRAHLQPALPL
jgi:Lon protease (S16) C-terminal proteolytic domain